MTLHEDPVRGPKPSAAALGFWEVFVEDGCLERLNERVREFLRARDSPVDLLPGKPHRAFIHSYANASGDATGGDGMTDHYDIVPHCAVTLCLSGDGDAPGLYWCRNRERRPLHLGAGDIAILARGVLHGVERVARREPRLVLVLFY